MMFVAGGIQVRASRVVLDVKRFISNISVIGCGIMGSGITAISAGSGHNVKLLGLDDSQLKKSEERILRILHRLSKSKLNDFIELAMSRIKFTTDICFATSDAAMVIEAITEDLKAKRELFK